MKPILSNGVTSGQDVLEEYTVTHEDQNQNPTGHHKIGTRGYLPDGRVFYYASNGVTALVAGSLLTLPGTTGLNIVASDDKIVLTNSYATWSVGATAPILYEADKDTADIIANAYAEGYCYVEVSTGLAQYYQIKAHDAIDFSGTSTSKKIELYDPIVTALAATSELSFARNPYARVQTSSTSQNETPVGVAGIAVTASGTIPTDAAAAANSVDTSFFWAQTWGPACVQVTSTSVAVGAVMVGGGTADEIDIHATTGHTSNQTTLGGIETPHVAWGLVSAAGAQAETVLVDLRIRP